jgi:ATP-binding cassette subfamily B protein RaxB
LENERAVNAALSQLAITRLVVAHRPDTLRAAGKVVSLEGGVMVEGDQCMTSKQENDYVNAESR